MLKTKLCLIASLAILPFTGWSQGSLTPSGAPTPTMKTLTQVEPRTIIGTLPFTITNSGSFYLSATLTGASGQNGIIVQASEVTLDLNGFALVGVGGSLNGITTGVNVQDLVVQNGTVRGWGGNGIDAGATINSRFERVHATANGGSGISSGAGSMVTGCMAYANGVDGIRVSSSAMVLNSSCVTNGASGIHATGINDRIEGNDVIGNIGAGITVDSTGSLVVKNNAAANSTNDYNVAPGSSYGQLVQQPGPGFTSATPWANFASSCPVGQSFCGNVCVVLASNVNNCGSCGNVCNFYNATGACISGGCAISACNPGFLNCNGNNSDGCEVNVQTDPNNCGGCAVVCPAIANGSAACLAGACSVGSCNSGFADCDHIAANGCEANLYTSVNNCGSCGNICAVANGAPGCVSGSCTIASCNSGFKDCNGLVADGCEVNSNTDPNNCGACGNHCSVLNGFAGCSSGSCTIAGCNSGYANCDGNSANGCEVNISADVNNCGGCGHVCFVSNGSAGCSSGACTVAGCNTGFANCDNNTANGCEINVNTDVNNCGSCGHVCSSINATPSCSAGSCSLICNTGYGNCDNNASNGCEDNLTNDNNNCGSCGNVCNATTSQCSASQCRLKTGQSCSTGTQCVSGVCSSSHCT